MTPASRPDSDDINLYSAMVEGDQEILEDMCVYPLHASEEVEPDYSGLDITPGVSILDTLAEWFPTATGLIVPLINLVAPKDSVADA